MFVSLTVTDTFSPYCMIFLTIADYQQSVVQMCLFVDVLLIILSPRSLDSSTTIRRVFHSLDSAALLLAFVHQLLLFVVPVKKNLRHLKVVNLK